MAGGGTPVGPSASPLGQAWGYGIVLGVGTLFALGMVSFSIVIHKLRLARWLMCMSAGLHNLGPQTL